MKAPPSGYYWVKLHKDSLWEVAYIYDDGTVRVWGLDRILPRVVYLHCVGPRICSCGLDAWRDNLLQEGDGPWSE